MSALLITSKAGGYLAISIGRCVGSGSSLFGSSWDVSSLHMARAMRSSSGPQPSIPSTTMRTASAALAASSARATPIFSTRSWDSRMPAVSSNRSGAPWRDVASASTTSRVVPATSDTMAFSQPAMALSRLLFPAFGRPTSATEAPLWSTRDFSASSRIRRTSTRSCFAPRTSAWRSSGGIPSASSKSTRASTSTIMATHVCFIFRMCMDASPRKPAKAASAARGVRAWTRRSMLSACARSMRPLSTARKVNSPGFAILAPAWSAQRSTRCAHTLPPCPCTSTTSSRV
mmetsp:Transcript_10480/g.64136  ORF Transcript_10480/g.64136 Transcript_10480/m.64136 type:complete len:288 (-) Transcript_10480:5331-6194(-)